jgi:rhomboid protease GluP
MHEPDEPGRALAEEVPPPREEAPPRFAATAPSLKDMLRSAPLTFVLAAINVAVFLWAERNGNTETITTLLQFGAAERVHVWSGEWWRLGTYMFLHIGWIHLLWNTYASIGWCVAVEKAVGSGRFLLVYLVSGVGAGCASVICHEAVTAGASGAMFGIVGLTLILRRRMLPSWDAFFQDRGVRSTFVNIGIWTVLGLTAIAMDNYAHGGGLVVGALAAWVITGPRASWAAWGAFAAAFALLFAAALRPW